jgi:hypothetical protein
MIHQLEPLRNPQGDAYPWVPCMAFPIAWDEASPFNVRKRAAEICTTHCPALAECEQATHRLEAEGGTPLGVWAGQVLNPRQVIERTAVRVRGCGRRIACRRCRRTGSR